MMVMVFEFYGDGFRFLVNVLWGVLLLFLVWSLFVFLGMEIVWFG